MEPRASTPWEIKLVKEIFERQPSRAVYLEIGVSRGGSLECFGRCMELGATLIGVDHKAPGVILKMTCADLRRQGYGVQLINGDSSKASTIAAVKDVLAGRPIDVLFIDGNHLLAGAAQDAANYIPLVRAGGVFCFHDCTPTIALDMGQRGIRDCQGIQAVWRDACFGRRAMLIAENAGYGLGWK